MLSILKRLPTLRAVLAVVFLLLQTAGALSLPYFMANIVNNGIAVGNTAYIMQQGSYMLIFTLLSLAGQVCNTYVAAKISYGLGFELRSDIYRKVLGFSKNEYDRFGMASLLTRNTNDVAQVQALVEMGLKFLIVSPLYLLGGIIMTFVLSPKLAMIFVAAIPFLVIATVIIYRYANPLYAKMQKLVDTLNLFFREGLTGVKVIRAFNKEAEDYNKYEAASTEYTKNAIAAGTIMSVLVPIITLFINLSMLLIAWVGAKSVSNGSMEVGAIMGAISYSVQILIGFSILTNVILSLPRGKVSVDRINAVLDMPVSIQDATNAVQPAAGALKFDHVGFRYAGAKKKALDDVCFSVEQGKRLAVIGSTGAGKTSLASLISRLYDVESGSIQLGGQDIRQMTQDGLHSSISFAPQKSTLFMGTIRDNMLIAKADATDREIWDALETACAAGFIKALPDGLDSLVEKGGGNFSGGQRQRLCIARALLKDADIYIFDDTFSALDFKTDAAVRAAMKERLKDKITVIVAQRINTIMDADRIVVLADGKLAGLGTHVELAGTNGVYKEMIDSQTYRGEVA